MLSTLLRDTDQMSMVHALEVRVPLIDHKLVEFLFTLPGHIKVDKGVPKPLLTKVLGDSIPQECIFRPKQGFELPFEIWLRKSLKSEMETNFLCSEENAVFPFDQIALSDTWSQFQRGRISWSRIWGVFGLRKWINNTHLV
jgi:asparagine synthase (glutamine-hydrolysing)